MNASNSSSKASSRPPARQQKLLSLAVIRVREGDLPAWKSSQLFAGSGHEQDCSLCDEPIGKDQIEYEIEAKDVDAGEPGKLYFHLHCYDAWLQACRHDGRERTTSEAP